MHRDCPVCGTKFAAKIVENIEGYTCPKCKYWGGQIKEIKEHFEPRAILITSPWHWEFDRTSYYPPLGLGYLAAAAWQEGFVNVDILDPEIQNMDEGDVLNFLKNRDYEIVGISSVTANFNSTKKIAKIARKALPNCRILLGGPHVTALPEQSLNEVPETNIVISGEGEVTFSELLKQSPLRNINGITYRENGDIIRNEKREYIKNLDSLPFPFQHSLSIKKFGGGVRGIGSIITSRGCPANCVYCSRAVFGTKFRVRSAELIVDEMEHLLLTYDIKSIALQDDSFTVKKSRVMKVCNLIKERNLDVKFSVITRVNTVNREMLMALKTAGAYMIEYGVESGSPEILKNIKKGITKEQIREAVRWTREAGLKVYLNFMFGLPGDTMETMKETIKFAEELKPDNPGLNITTPLPGAELYEHLLNEGKILSSNWSDYVYGNFQDKESTNLVLFSNFSKDELKKLMLDAKRRLLCDINVLTNVRKNPHEVRTISIHFYKDSHRAGVKYRAIALLASVIISYINLKTNMGVLLRKARIRY